MPKQNDIPRTGSNLSSSVSSSVSSMKESASSAMGKAAKKVGIKKDEPDLVDEISEFCPKLTYQQVRSHQLNECKMGCKAIKMNYSNFYIV